MSLKFAWDERKNRRNITKHGIDFADVSPMFELPMLVQANREDGAGESRWTGIGWLNSNLCVVVFTEDDAGRIRIISARKATKQEAKQYGEELKH